MCAPIAKVGVLVGLGIVLIYGGWRLTRPSLESRIERCVRGRGCQGVAAISGTQEISSEQLDRLMRLPAVHAGGERVLRCFTSTSGDARAWMLSADCGKGQEAFPIAMIDSDGQSTLLLGPMLIALLKVQILARHQTIDTAGQVYAELASSLQAMAPMLSDLGIQTIELGDFKRYSPSEAVAALHELSKQNSDRPLRRFHL